MKSTIVFDESHNETWTIHGTKAVVNSLDNPAYYSYAHLPAIIEKHLGVAVERNIRVPITAATLKDAAVLVIAHPADPSVHRGCGGTPVFQADEITVIEEFVLGGGGLLVLSEHHAELWRSNVNDLLSRFGVRFLDDVVEVVYSTVLGSERSAQFATSRIAEHQACRGVRSISYYAGCSIACAGGPPWVMVEAPHGEILAVGGNYGKGRLCAIGDSDIFAMPYLFEFDNYTFLLGMLQWLIGRDEIVAHHAASGSQTASTSLGPSIFVSYSRKDAEIVRELCRVLRVFGCRPWLDEESILPGERFEDAIREAIARCDFFMPCISSRSIDMRGVLQKEIALALSIAEGMLERDIYIIPVRLEDCMPQRSLMKYQWVDLFQPHGFDRIVAAIREGMSRRVAIGNP